MSDRTQTFADAYNMLCGKLIAQGIHRQVFTCRIRDDLVVKVEIEEDFRSFSNVFEQKFWDDHQHYKPVARWLAPCEYLAPDGRIMLQRRVSPITKRDKLPDRIPSFLTDIKRENFGWLDGRLVCVDYAMTIPAPSIRLKTAHWGSE